MNILLLILNFCTLSAYTKQFSVDIELRDPNGSLYEKPSNFGENIDSSLSLIGSSEHKNLTHVPEFIGEIKDYKDVQIFGKVFIGSNLQPFWMIMDTGSNWLWISSRICTNCNPLVPKFNETQSTSFSFCDVILDLHYGSGDVYGYDSFD